MLGAKKRPTELVGDWLLIEIEGEFFDQAEAARAGAQQQLPSFESELETGLVTLRIMVQA